MGYTTDNKNPDPVNWEPTRAEYLNGYLILEVRYPNATNTNSRRVDAGSQIGRRVVWNADTVQEDLPTR